MITTPGSSYTYIPGLSSQRRSRRGRSTIHYNVFPSESPVISVGNVQGTLNNETPTFITPPISPVTVVTPWAPIKSKTFEIIQPLPLPSSSPSLSTTPYSQLNLLNNPPITPLSITPLSITPLLSPPSSSRVRGTVPIVSPPPTLSFATASSPPPLIRKTQTGRLTLPASLESNLILSDNPISMVGRPGITGRINNGPGLYTGKSLMLPLFSTPSSIIGAEQAKLISPANPEDILPIPNFRTARTTSQMPFESLKVSSMAPTINNIPGTTGPLSLPISPVQPIGLVNPVSSIVPPISLSSTSRMMLPPRASSPTRVSQGLPIDSVNQGVLPVALPAGSISPINSPVNSPRAFTAADYAALSPISSPISSPRSMPSNSLVPPIISPVSSPRTPSLPLTPILSPTNSRRTDLVNPSALIPGISPISSPISSGGRPSNLNWRYPNYPWYTPMTSDNPRKKRMVRIYNPQTRRDELIYFGAVGYPDFLSDPDPKRRKAYLARSAGIRERGILSMDDYKSPNFWSRRILWKSGEPIRVALPSGMEAYQLPGGVFPLNS